ncbi:terpene synthase metal binding domain protein [Penicillium capsulatum]|uniref:Terpene synthase n=1 Tax=Penicillium capsulatum TaxID=69766 RepID=A0A9W9HNH0_9EURO|nr:terpene synthase metal binding domain protein [Penicillium capsulatum]KAJ6112363.1 terpene synthase metal binding domain protein [Penicillium capsulatum]
MIDQQKTVQVTLPDLFVGFLARKPVLHQDYDHTRVASESWLSDLCNFPSHFQKTVHKIDIAYYCAILLPHVDADRFRVVCDWMNWVFPFDDALDNGPLKENPEDVRELVDGLMGIFDTNTTHEHENKLLLAFESIWLRVLQSSCPGIQRRFASAMRDYCEAIFQQVVLQKGSRQKRLGVKSTLQMRRQSVATMPLFALVEYAHALRIPDDVFECKSIKEIQRVGTDLVLLQNDLISYRKEKALGESHNIISIYQQEGYTIQEAFDEVERSLSECYRDWYLALAQLPSWGEEIDSQVHLYIDGVQNAALANIHWSFRVDRYWGNSQDVRKTRIIDLPAEVVAPKQSKIDVDISNKGILFPVFFLVGVLGSIFAVPRVFDLAS